MKELYISPLVETICFAPAQPVAFSFDSLLDAANGNNQSGLVDGADPSETDIPLDIAL